jgi:hypothetical protein
LRRFFAIGRPMRPSPMNPTRSLMAIRGLYQMRAADFDVV